MPPYGNPDRTKGGRSRPHVTLHSITHTLAIAAAITEDESDVMLQAFVSLIRVRLKRGQTTRVPYFGTFYVGKRKSRSGRDPRNGAAIIIPAKKVPKFRVTKYLKDQLTY